MEPTAADVMPKVIIRESLSATGGTLQEQATREAGKRVVDKAKEGAWREALDATNRKKPIEQKTIDRKLDEIGVERDATTRKKIRTTEEEARFKRTKDAASLAKKTIEQGYDKLDPTEQTKLRTAIEDKIRANPLLLSEFNSLSTTQQRAEVERRLKDPKFLADLSEEVSVHLNPEKKLIEEQKIIEREEDLKEKELTKKEAEDAVTDLDTQIKALDAELKAFERTPAGGVGVKAVELDGLRVNLKATQTELETHRITLEYATSELAGFISERDMTRRYGAAPGSRRAAADIEVDIAAKKAEVKVAQREVDTREGKIRRIAELETQEASLKEEKLKAETGKREKSISLRKADLELSKSQRRRDDLKREREYEEEDLASNMENVFARTADKYIRDEFQAIETKVNAELDEMKKKTSDVHEQAMIETLQKRWEGKERGSGHRKYKPISKEQVEKDFIALKDKGPEPLMEEMLMTRTNPKTGANYYTSAEAKQMLADKSDTSFYKKMEPEVVLQLIRRKLMTGGVRREDLFVIESSAWGEGVIKKALSKNNEFKKQMEELTGESAVNPGFGRKLWEQTKKRPWLLALLVGLVALPVLAAKEGTSSIVK